MYQVGHMLGRWSREVAVRLATTLSRQSGEPVTLRSERGGQVVPVGSVYVSPTGDVVTLGV